MKHLSVSAKRLTTVCSILVIAVFRACQPEALGADQLRDRNQIPADNEDRPHAALDHHANKNIPLKQSYGLPPEGGGGGRRDDLAAKRLDDRVGDVAPRLKVDDNVAYHQVNDGPLPAGPAGDDGKKVARDDDGEGRREPRKGRNPAAPRSDGRRGGAAPPSTRLADHPDCRDDVRRICVDGSLNLNNNFAVLDCLQRDRRDDADLSDACHHYIWFYKKNLTQDERFDAAAFEVCKPALDALPDCQKQVRSRCDLRAA